jgi:DNA-binding NarL/FixJ family response regulator
MPRVFLSCQDRGYCGKLRASLQIDPDFEICGEGRNSLKAVKEALRLQPDLVIVEMEIANKNDFELAESIKRALPKVPLFLVTQGRDYRIERRALSRGVDAVFEKADDVIALRLNARAVAGLS